MRKLWELINTDVKALKAELAQSKTLKQKAFFWFALLIRSLVTLAFCVVFVLVIVTIFGDDMAICAVVLLLSILTFQKVHLGYKPAQGAFALVFIYAIFAICPPLAAASSPGLAFIINMLSLFVIVMLGCGKVHFQNHIVLVLSYLLLYGYPVEDGRLWVRCLVLGIGGIWAASILYRHNRDKHCTETLGDVLKNFHPSVPDDQWKLKLAILVPLSMLVGEMLGLERTMWIGICAMSVLNPTKHLRLKIACERFLGTLIGAGVFYLATLIPGLPGPTIGMAGGFLVGLSTSYRFQTIFNSLGALSIAMLIYGPVGSLWYRILDNALAIMFITVSVYIIDGIICIIDKRRGTAY